MKSYFLKPKQAAEFTGYSIATINRYKAFINDHADRYGEFVTGRPTINLLCFYDAEKYKPYIEAGLDVPAFDPELVRRYL